MFSFVKKLSKCLPMWLHCFVSPPAVKESSFCSESSPTFGVVCVLDFDHSHRCTVVARCCLNLHFLGDMLCGVSFHTQSCHLYVSCDEVSAKV